MHTYVVEHDFGFAPNPFFRVCSLATCKPQLRKKANIGDLVIGAGSKKHNHETRLVYFMIVDEITSFDDYWTDKRFERKRPSMTAGLMQAVGDNIYHRDADGRWLQEYSLHRAPGGPPDNEHLDRDTGSERVLLGRDFVYFGGQGPEVPDRVLGAGKTLLVGGRPVRCKFTVNQIETTLKWFRSLDASGFIGRPLDWSLMGRVLSAPALT